jgi:transcriptional regulator with XRE-family HTH domain
MKAPKSNAETEFSTGSFLKQLRGKVNQDEFARLLGVGRTTLIRYESGERDPDAAFLRRLHFELGVDPLEVLTGVRTNAPALSAEEVDLIAQYRAADERGRSVIDQVADLAARRVTTPGVAQTNSGTRAIQIGNAGGKVAIKTR